MKRLMCVLILSGAFLTPAGAEPPGRVFRPGLGDLMTMSVQPRHIKLGLGGDAANWAYAAYEANELREALDDVKAAVPVHDGFPVAKRLPQFMDPALAAIDAAIKATDAAAFTRAYAGLTQACNACHKISGHEMIVIQVPAASSFPDQDFRPVPR